MNICTKYLVHFQYVEKKISTILSTLPVFMRKEHKYQVHFQVPTKILLTIGKRGVRRQKLEKTEERQWYGWDARKDFQIVITSNYSLQNARDLINERD